MVTFRKLLQTLRFWKRLKALSHESDRTNSTESSTEPNEANFVDELEESVQCEYADSITSDDASAYSDEEEDTPRPALQVEVDQRGHDSYIDEMYSSPSANLSDDEESTEQSDVDEASRVEQSEEDDRLDDTSDGISRLGHKPPSRQSVSDSVASTRTHGSDSSPDDQRPHAIFPPEISPEVPSSWSKMSRNYDREERELRTKTRSLNPPRTCVVCDESKPLDDFAIISHPHTAKETICVECMRMYLHTKIVTDGTVDIVCPLDGCQKAILYHHVQEYASENDFALFDGLLLRRANEQDPMFRWCSNPECAAGQIVENYENASYFTCPECHSQTCVDCLVPFHPSQTCGQVKEASMASMEKASNEWLEENARTCPSCLRWVQKSSGCDHMICRCRAEFCYKCGASYSKIRAKGNTAHARACPHYA